jgi:glutamate dehydrogenase
MVNDMGLNFMFRIQEETGASVDDVANAYAIVHGIFDMETLWSRIEDLDNVISAKLQLKMLDEARRIMRRAARWYIRHGNKALSIEEAIASYRETFNNLSKNLQNYLVEAEYSLLEEKTSTYVSQDVPKDIAYQVASFSNMFSSFDLAHVVAAEKRNVDVVARLYFQLGSKLELHWFLDQINNQAVSNHWQALARASYREELDWQQRSITANLLQINPEASDADKILEDWMQSNQVLLKRWYHMMSEFKTSTTHEFAKFSVALRELMLLSVKSSH